MNYGELQQAIIEDTHRADLASLVPRFIREGEGLINRRLKAYPLTATLTDSDRVSPLSSMYTLPAGFLQVRAIHVQGRDGDALTPVSPTAIRRLPLTAQVQQFALYGDDRIEFRGNPGEETVMDLLYYGRPEPLANPGDTNALLQEHEGLYLAAAKFYVYIHTQDRELASDEQDMWMGILDDLNEQFGRKIGGSSVASSYNMTSRSAY